MKVLILAVLFSALPLASCCMFAGGGGCGHGGHSASHATARPPEPPAPVEDRQPPAAATYVCPMHPEVQGVAGGTCSFCGMPLVPKT